MLNTCKCKKNFITAIGWTLLCFLLSYYRIIVMSGHKLSFYCGIFAATKSLYCVQQALLPGWMWPMTLLHQHVSPRLPQLLCRKNLQLRKSETRSCMWMLIWPILQLRARSTPCMITGQSCGQSYGGWGGGVNVMKVFTFSLKFMLTCIMVHGRQLMCCKAKLHLIVTEFSLVNKITYSVHLNI